MRRILKKNRETTPRSSNEGIRSQETASTSEASSMFTKAKSTFNRIRNRTLPNTVPKEEMSSSMNRVKDREMNLEDPPTQRQARDCLLYLIRTWVQRSTTNR
ncbi:hypothetical protein J3A83DRAFT_4191259 [Scleroderma citrinum]